MNRLLRSKNKSIHKASGRQYNLGKKILTESNYLKSYSSIDRSKKIDTNKNTSANNKPTEINSSNSNGN